MANPAGLTVSPGMIVTDTTGGVTTLSSNTAYIVRHTGLENSSTPTASTATVYLTLRQSGTAITANGVEGSNKFPLLSGEATVIGPGVDKLGWRAVSGGPVLSIMVGSQ